MEGEVNLLNEIQAIIRKGQSSASGELPDVVGGVEGEQGIAEMFKESYEALFNLGPSV